MAARQDEQLVANALCMALKQRRPQAGLRHHSDRGCQYTSQQYQETLTRFGIKVSMSRRGNCYDNALSESFFGTLKRECVEPARFQTRAQARQAIFEYTECFYNRVRRHSTLGYKSPAVYEQLMGSSSSLQSLQKWFKLMYLRSKGVKKPFRCQMANDDDDFGKPRRNRGTVGRRGLNLNAMIRYH